MNMTLGQAMKMLRSMKQMSHTDVAKAAGLSRSFVSSIESDGRNPSLENLRKICDALGVNMVLLLMLSEGDHPALSPYLPLVYSQLVKTVGMPMVVREDD